MRGDQRPNFERLRRVLLREGPPGPVPAIEFLADVQLMEKLVGEKFPLDSLGELGACSPDECERACDLVIRFHRQLGYDYAFVLVDIPFEARYTASSDTAVAGATRFWQDQSAGNITSWHDFEGYPWPSRQDIDYRALEYTARNLPDGMQIVAVCDGPFEWVKALMGLEPLAFALIDEPELVRAVCDRVGGLVAVACDAMVQVPRVGAVFVSDDMGYSTSTMISPKHLREYFFPWQRKLSEIVHSAGLPFLLHACGNVTAVMQDLIEDVRIDGKHSYEDKIMPVEEVMARWGDHISILGGVDMDLLARGSQDEVRWRTRQILNACGPRGGYCLGTGNTAANYIPLGNYLAMLDEGQRWNQEHFGRT